MKRLGMPLFALVATLSQAAAPVATQPAPSATTAASASAPKPVKPGMHFVKYLGSLDKYIPIQTASLGDKNFGVLFIQAPVKNGWHTLTFTIYDGAANEVRKSNTTLEAKNNRLVFSSLHSFGKSDVAIGTWTWVSELDGEPQFTEAIYVGP